MSIFDPRYKYRPFEYPQAEEFWLEQQHAHWMHTEINMAKDIKQWATGEITENEKYVVGTVLKTFTSLEVFVGDLWTQIHQCFPVPEIQSMASSFSAMEAIHARAYALLNDSLGLDDYEEFLEDPVARQKVDKLLSLSTDDVRSTALALAVFSGGVEGVSLFSAFAILLSFSLRSKLMSVGEIIRFSIRDESLHSRAGCWLFQQLVQEFPEVWDEEFKKEIVEAMESIVLLEDQFMDQAFEGGDLENLAKEDLKAYIRYRANTKLGDLGLPKNWDNVDMEKAGRVITWFEAMTVGVTSQDFFSGRETAYSKGTKKFTELVWE